MNTITPGYTKNLTVPILDAGPGVVLVGVVVDGFRGHRAGSGSGEAAAQMPGKDGMRNPGVERRLADLMKETALG